MQQIKIREDLWKLILEGKKKYEFRKLEKGFTTGTYTFVDLETSKVLGTAKLTPLHVNPRMLKQTLCQNDNCETDQSDYCTCENENFKDVDWGFISREKEVDRCFEDEPDFRVFYESEETSIDQASYEFVSENYVKQNIDFVVYKIEEAVAKEGK